MHFRRRHALYHNGLVAGDCIHCPVEPLVLDGLFRVSRERHVR
jgi:hypothetical protein